MAEPLEDVDSLLLRRLGRGYDSRKVEAVREVVERLRGDKANLDEAVKDGDLSGRQFAERTNALVHDYLRRIAKILGPTDYERVFGEPPDRPMNVVDPDIAAGVTYRK
jgi:hypothetical protein